MASMTRYEGHASTAAGNVFARGFAPAAESLAAFRVNLPTDDTKSLSALIESEIIPRLMIAHAVATPGAPAPVDTVAITPDEIATFAPLVMQIEADAVLLHVEAMLARGVPFDSILVDLLAPAARVLGEYWEEDRCDFVDVTMGLWRLQEVVHEISGRLPAKPVPADRRALFAPMPGDQHSFGTVVIDDIFRRDGWLTERLTESETPNLLKRAAEDWFDIIGLTVSCDCHIPGVTKIIAALRNVSHNPRVCVMVGGRIFSADPDLAILVGADGTASDAKLAPRVASDLIREREWADVVRI